MNKNLIDMIEAVSYEKSMPKDTVWSAMEAAVAALARKENKGGAGEFKATIQKDGSVDAVRLWQVVAPEDIEDPERQISVHDDIIADWTDTAAAVGDVVEEPVDEPTWTRQGAQVVKQVLAQRLKQGLRVSIAEQWAGRVGETHIGLVKRVDRDRIIVDLGEPVEGVMGQRDRIPGEMFKVGQRVRVLIKDVQADGQGPVITVSRSDDAFLRELIGIEVPEVDMGQVIIHGVARDPGSRAKVAVEAGRGLRSHPAAVCVGMRGVRAQAISGEINGERVEFIEWNENPAEFILAALHPAEVRTLVLDEDDKRAMVGVDAENLARAIGGRGQNVRLAARLTGWNIDIMSSEELQGRRDSEDETSRQNLVSLIDIDEELAGILVEEGFLTIEDIALSPIGDLLVIEGMDQDTVLALQERARDSMALRQMLHADDDSVPETLADLGFAPEEVVALALQDVVSIQDLADQAVGDLDWPDADQQELGTRIMQARALVGMI